MIRNIKEGFYLIYQVLFKSITLQDEIKTLNCNQAWLKMFKALPSSIFLILTVVFMCRMILAILGFSPYSWINILVGIGCGFVGGIALGIVLCILFPTSPEGIVSNIGFVIPFSIAWGIASGSSITIGIVVPFIWWLSYLGIIGWVIESPILIISYALARRKTDYETIYSLYCKASILWDERIMIPLPFLSRFLELLAKYDRNKGQDEILRVAIKSKQHRAASLAMIKINEIVELREKCNYLAVRSNG